MHQTKELTILAIDPGTRFMGVAALRGDALVHHGVAILTATGAPHQRLAELRCLVLGLIREFHPTVLAVESAFFGRDRSTALLNLLVDEIRSIARKRGLAVRSFAPTAVKKALCGNGMATKREVALAVLERYPELAAYFDQGSARRRRYHGNMFDAVAVGILAGQPPTAFPGVRLGSAFPKRESTVRPAPPA